VIAKEEVGVHDNAMSDDITVLLEILQHFHLKKNDDELKPVLNRARLPEQLRTLRIHFLQFSHT
jgi:hypothetical protein